MTPNEHLEKAETLLQTADAWGPSSESAARAALQATAHVQLALAKIQRHDEGSFGWWEDE